MPNQDEIALANYRIEKAKKCLKASKLLLDDELYADSAKLLLCNISFNECFICTEKHRI